MDKKEALIKQWLNEGTVKNPKIIQAFRDLERAKFIPKDLKDEAYGDYPLPILANQTISQPTTVVMMLEALELKSDDVVLEIGAGSGYQAALLSKLCKKLYTLEIIQELAEFAKENIKKAGITNVEIIEADGRKGYKQAAPFDKIILTAATEEFPKPLIDQLVEGGIILAPLGPPYEQVLTKARKIKGELHKEKLGYFVFVPLTGKYG